MTTIATTPHGTFEITWGLGDGEAHDMMNGYETSYDEKTEIVCANENKVPYRFRLMRRASDQKGLLVACELSNCIWAIGKPIEQKNDGGPFGRVSSDDG